MRMNSGGNARRGGEEGFALVTSIMILVIAGLFALAITQTVNVETHQSGNEVAGEAAFNLAQSALAAEALQLQQAWPGTVASKYPATCNQSSTPTTGCPGTALTQSFNSTYSGPNYANPTWNVEVIDDATSTTDDTAKPSFYSDSLAASPITWDQNGDGRVWIRAQTTDGSQQRIVVEQIVRQQQVVTLPQNVITAGGVYTSNNGNKVIIEGKDPVSGLVGQVDVRCSATQVVYGSDCLGWESDKNKQQLDPDGDYQANYVDPNGGYSTLSESQLAALKQTAISNGTYYPTGTCPPAGQAGVVYVENANCVYQDTTTWNSASAPGALIFASGTLEFNGNLFFYGILYMGNGQGTTPTSGPCTDAQLGSSPVFTVHGGGQLYGGIFVDRCGLVDAGDQKFDVNYSSSAFSGLKTIVTPDEAKNTFRIIANP
jgi:Tfp pilus assembly protein PilX